MSDSLEQLLGKLDGIGGDIRKSAKKGLLQAAKKIQGDAKRLCPVNHGRLRNSITAEAADEGGDIVAAVGTNVNYAAYVEFGTGPAGSRSPKDAPPDMNLSYRGDGWVYQDDDGGYKYTEGQPAKPFLYPAFKQNKHDITDIIARSIMNDIKAGGGDD